MIPLLLTLLATPQVSTQGRILTVEACGQRRRITPYPSQDRGRVIVAVYALCLPVIISDWWPDEYAVRSEAILVGEEGEEVVEDTQSAEGPSMLDLSLLGNLALPSFSLAWATVHVSRAEMETRIQGPALYFQRWCYTDQRWAACTRFRPDPVSTR